MVKVGQVVARRMTAGAPNRVRHIEALQWGTKEGPLEWSSRATMVSRVENSARGIFFTEVNGYTAPLYTVHRESSSWVQTEPDETKIDNLLQLPLG